MVVIRIISIVLHHALVNFMITDEVFVKWVSKVFENSEINK